MSKGYCGSNNNFVNYKICIFDTERSNCFDDENLQNNNNTIYLLISEGESGALSVSLQVNSIKNGTVISVFCISQDCDSHFSNVLLTSLQVFCKLIMLSLGIIYLTLITNYSVVCEECDINAECVEDMCVCKEGYTGDGRHCEKGREVHKMHTQIIIL